MSSASAVSRVISTDEGKAMVRSFLARSDMPSFNIDLEAIDSCHCAYQKAFRQLHSSIGILLLNSAILSPTEEQKDFRSDLISFLEVQRKLKQPSCPERVVRVKSPPISILKAPSSPQSVSASRSWKDRLIQEMSQDASFRSKSIIRIVGEVCRDLELRCEDTERPLREEQSKVYNLEANLQQCEAKLHKLKEEFETTQLQVERLKDEKDICNEDLSLCEHRLQDMNCKHDRLHEELDKSKEAAQHSADIATESGRQQEFAYLAIVTGKDELIESQASQIAANGRQNRALEDTLAQIRSQQATVAEKVQADSRIIEDLRGNIAHLSVSEKSLQANVESVLRQASEAASTKDENIAELTSRMLAAETEMVQLIHQHHRETEEKVTASQKAQAEISNLQSELLQARRDAAQSAATFEKTIVGLEKEILTFQEERQARASEFAEAQELSTRLMAIVGKKPTSAHAPAEELRLSRCLETVKNKRHSPSREGTQIKIMRKHSRSPLQSTKLNRPRAKERLRCRRNASSSPIPSAGALFASNFAETNSTSSAVSPTREPLTPHLSASNRGPMASKQGVDENGRDSPVSDEFIPDADVFGRLHDHQLVGQRNAPCCTNDKMAAEI